MTDSHLDSLIFKSCKKDLTDAIDTDYIAKVWAELKSAEIQTNQDIDMEMRLAEILIVVQITRPNILVCFIVFN